MTGGGGFGACVCVCAHLCVCGLNKSNNRCTHVATSAYADIFVVQKHLFSAVNSISSTHWSGPPSTQHRSPNPEVFFSRDKEHPPLCHILVPLRDLLLKGEPFHMASISKLASFSSFFLLRWDFQALCPSVFSKATQHRKLKGLPTRVFKTDGHNSATNKDKSDH